MSGSPFTPYFPNFRSVLMPQSALDGTINALGMRVGWCKAYACPCGQSGSGSFGSANPKCLTCFGRGTYWDEPVPFTALITFMHTSSAPDELGAAMNPVQGTTLHAAPTLSIPYSNADGSPCLAWSLAAEKDAFIEYDSTARFNTPLVSGDTIYLPYRQNLVILGVTTYDTSTNLVSPVLATNYTVSGSSVVLNPNVYPDGTPYVVEYTAAVVYVAFRTSGGVPHSRPAGGGANLPRRFHLELLDVWTRNLNNPAAQSVPI